ncbi:MAG: hypothetical protein KAI47_05390, partial [Deltaproteobacteria bacterium]|nr:hypothetical protein [Deltaproteobacteria bacterium]
MYRALTWGVMPLTLPFFAWHPRLRGGLGQRFGRLPSRVEHFRQGIWYHGASAGDCNAILPLAQRSATVHPVVLTSFTRSGAEMLRSRLDPEDKRLLALRAPLEVGFAVERFFSRLRPRLLVLECLELWPLWIAAAARHGVPVAIVNGRLSARSLSRYRRAPKVFSSLFASLRLVVALGRDEAARFVQAGVPASRVVTSSSTKHGAQHLEQGFSRRRSPKIVLGSVHASELRAILPGLLARLPRES